LTVTKIGYRLAIFLMIYLALVTGILLTDYLVQSPSMPGLADVGSTTLENYQKLSKMATDRTLRLFDQLVYKSFLPVFTAILGYIFGIRGVEKEDS